MPNLCIIPARALSDDRVTPTQLRVLLAVGTFTSRDGGGVWASNATIAEVAGLHVRHMRDALKALVSFGYVRKIARPGRTAIMAIVLDDPLEPPCTESVQTRKVKPAAPCTESVQTTSHEFGAPGCTKSVHQTTSLAAPVNEILSANAERPSVGVDPAMVFDLADDDELAVQPIDQPAAGAPHRRRAPAKPKPPAQFPNFTAELRGQLLTIWEEGVRPLANGEHGRLFATFGPFFRMPEAERPPEHPRDAEVMAALVEILSARADGLGGDKYGSPTYAAEKIRPVVHILRECTYDPAARLDRVDRALGLRRHPSAGGSSFR
jgi:hypothetical protein